MKKFVGFVIARIGAYLWEKGGFWNESNDYEDLTKFGKLGYNLFCKGMSMMGVTDEAIKEAFAYDDHLKTEEGS